MKPKVIFGIILAALLLAVPAVYFAQAQRPTVSQAPITVPLNADVLFAKVNDQRTQNGLKPLVRDSRLDAIAQGRADDMVARNYFAHRDPVTDENLVKWIDYCSFNSENISNGIYSDNGDYNKNVVRSWMNSKPHHDAILRADYNLSGMALNGSKIVQIFCIAK